MSLVIAAAAMAMAIFEGAAWNRNGRQWNFGFVAALYAAAVAVNIAAWAGLEVSLVMPVLKLFGPLMGMGG